MTIADITNDLATALVTRRLKTDGGKIAPGTIVGGLLLERIAAGGAALSCTTNNRTPNETLLVMTPYIETFEAAVSEVNALTRALAKATRRTGVKTFNYTFTTNPHAKCNAACLNATGDDCTCSCGGANHGAHSGHIAPVSLARIDAEMNTIVANAERAADRRTYSRDFAMKVA